MIASLEHMADITAQLAKVLFDRCGGHSDLVTEIVKDISRENFSENSKTTNAVRNLSHFIVYNLSQIVFDRSHVDGLLRASARCPSRLPSSATKTSGSRGLYVAFGHRAEFGTARSQNPFHSDGRGK